MLASAGEFSEFGRSELEQAIHRRFERQAVRHADRVAVRTGSACLDYRSLDRLGNRVAHALLSARGIRQECVALLVDQGPALAGAILGCLKAGKIYVPLDPEAPRAALTRMLRSAGPGLIVADGRHLQLAADVGEGCPVADHVETSRRDWPDGSPGLAVAPDAPACVYYTSGSTGDPKGVVDCHRNVLHNIMRYTNGLKIGPQDRLTLLQSPGFSGAVSSLFGALLNGASVHPIAPRRESPASLARWVRAHRLTMWHSVPSLFRLLCSAGGEFPSVRVVRLEGDRASPSDVDLFGEHFATDCVLVNGLGATETGISRRYFLARGAKPVGSVVPVGYAVDDMDVAVVDEDGIPLPEGHAGEIVVRSRYLAPGYWKRPDLTARAFRDCADGARAYWTGDLGRMLADGCLEHLGRLDARVKIRGHWVALADVEAVLAQAPGVRQAAVGVAEASDGEARLVGHVVPERGATPTATSLRRHLAARLAPHQVPSAFVTLGELPVDRNGKVDRGALPPAGTDRPSLDDPYAPPAGAGEQRLAQLWQRVLRLDAVGIDDDFFDLGGDSLTAAQVVSELELDPAVLLGFPTIRRLARRLETGAADGEDRLLHVLRASGEKPPLFCVPGHGGVLMGYNTLARLLPGDQPVLAFLPPPATPWPPRTVAGLAAACVDELLRCRPRGPRLLSGVCFGGFVAYEMACQLRARGEAVDSLILIDCFNDAWFTGQSWAVRIGARAALATRRAGLHCGEAVRLGPRAGARHLRRRLQVVIENRRERQAQRDFERLAQPGNPCPADPAAAGRANRAAARAWAPRPYDGRVILMAGAEARAGVYAAPLMGWAALLRGEVESETAPDGLRGLLCEPTIRGVARRVSTEAARIGEGLRIEPERDPPAVA